MSELQCGCGNELPPYDGVGRPRLHCHTCRGPRTKARATTTLEQLPDLEDVDHLAWALSVLADDGHMPTKRVSDFVLRLLIDTADFACMDKLLERRRRYPLNDEAPTEGLEYVLQHLSSDGGICYHAMITPLQHFILTANFPAIEALFDECVKEFQEAEADDAAQREYERTCRTVTCPHCGARRGADCVSRSGLPAAIHSARARFVLTLAPAVPPTDGR